MMNRDAYLRNQSHCDLLVEHAWAHLIEDFGLDHVVAVHDHDDVFWRDLVASSHPWEDLREHDMVEVCAFAVELAGLLDAVSDVEHVGVAYIQPSECIQHGVVHVVAMDCMNTTRTSPCSQRTAYRERMKMEVVCSECVVVLFKQKQNFDKRRRGVIVIPCHVFQV
jgi:hypothetical protein